MAFPVELHVHPPTRRELGLLVLAFASLLLATAAGYWALNQGWLTFWPFGTEDQTGPAVLDVTSQPTGATLTVDGRDRGRTPARLGVTPGQHTVVLQTPDSIPSHQQVTVGPAGASLSATLWSREPALTHLRPTYPGASIAAVSFVGDGRVALIMSMPPTGSREAWLLDPRGATLERLGPPGQWPALAVAPDGRQVAYLAAGTATAPTPAALPSPTAGSASVNARLDEVWTSGSDSSVAPRRLTRLVTGNERLVDLSWAPDGRHLLLVARQSLALGGEQTRLLWLALDEPSAEPRELLTLPADIVAASYSWEPQGHGVAFLARPTTGGPVAVCLLATVDGVFRYLGDLVPEGGVGAAATVAPVAWDAAGGVVYAATAAPAAHVPNDTPLFGLRPMGGPRTTLGVFRARSTAGTDDERLASGDGSAGLALRDDGTVLSLARPKSDGPVILRAIDPAGTQVDDLAELAVPPSPGGASLGGRWDLAHAELLLALPTGSLATNAPADYWLVRFVAGPGAEVTR